MMIFSLGFELSIIGKIAKANPQIMWVTNLPSHPPTFNLINHLYKFMKLL